MSVSIVWLVVNKKIIYKNSLCCTCTPPLVTTGVPLPGLEALLAADEATPGNHDEAMNNQFHANMKHCIVQWKVNV